MEIESKEIVIQWVIRDKSGYYNKMQEEQQAFNEKRLF